ncbi:MAG: MarR family transcriptional regulator [Dehalococcoidia bacterium]|nr:MarR family transcriptional regulator [Dehalococcoidia bacterium]
MVAESADRPGDLPAKVVAALDRLARGQRSRRQAIAAAHGITPLQAELLSTLALGEPPAPAIGLLARELGISQPTVTDSLRALERKGFIAREKQHADARLVSVVLTPDGEQLCGQLAAGDRELIAAAASLHPPAQEALLEHTLALIARLVGLGYINVARTCLTCRFYEQADGGIHRCRLLDTALGPAELRVNCPEHEPALSA